MWIFFWQMVVFSFATATLIQVAYWCFIFRKLAFYPLQKEEKPLDSKQSEGVTKFPISVVVCAKNEAVYLKKHLPHLLEQDYPQFEVVVVNDNSDDESGAVLQSFQEKYPDILKVLTLKEKKGMGKKAALTAGIHFAQYEWLLLTDADCRPESSLWIATMQTAIEPHTEMLLGISPYIQYDGFLNTWIRFEAFWTAIQYLSFALIGQPYMGVGRNIMYKKSLWTKMNGFENHQHIASGDDDLFVSAISKEEKKEREKKNQKKGEKIKIIIAKNSFVWSEPKTQWNEYITQKRRHLTTASHYTLTQKIILIILSFSHLVWILGGFLLLVFKISTIFAVSFLILRFVTVYYFYGLITKRLHSPTFSFSRFFWEVLFWDTLLVVYYTVFSPALLLNAKRWK